MNIKIFGVLIIFLSIVFFIPGCKGKTENLQYTLPHLPYPIAKERALVTVAGQGPEGLVTAKICDDLKVRNIFNYRAKREDLENKKSLLIVVAVSNTGMKSVATNLSEEKKRVESLAAKASEQRIPIILLYLSGANRWDKPNQEMLALIGKYANYIIAISSLDSESFFRNLAAPKSIPLTLVKDLERFYVPLNSVFR